MRVSSSGAITMASWLVAISVAPPALPPIPQ
jgi:hypothetical protein